MLHNVNRETGLKRETQCKRNGLMKCLYYLHDVAFSLLRSSWSHSSSELPLSAFVTRVSFSRGVKIIRSIRSLRCCAPLLYFFEVIGAVDWYIFLVLLYTGIQIDWLHLVWVARIVFLWKATTAESLIPPTHYTTKSNAGHFSSMMTAHFLFPDQLQRRVQTPVSYAAFKLSADTQCTRF